MKKPFLMGLLILLSINCLAQKEVDEKKPLKNTVTFNVLRLVYNEARFGYERKLGEKFNIRGVFGLQYPTKSDEYSSSEPLGYYHTDNFYLVSKGLVLGIGVNHFFDETSRFYWSLEALLGYYYYNKKYHRLCTGMSSYNYLSLESMNFTRATAKVLIGKKHTVFKGKRGGLELDLFAGLGVKREIKNEEMFGIIYGKCDSNIEDIVISATPDKRRPSKSWLPSINAGVLIGLPF